MGDSQQLNLSMYLILGYHLMISIPRFLRSNIVLIVIFPVLATIVYKNHNNLKIIGNANEIIHHSSMFCFSDLFNCVGTAKLCFHFD